MPYDGRSRTDRRNPQLRKVNFDDEQRNRDCKNSFVEKRQALKLKKVALLFAMKALQLFSQLRHNLEQISDQSDVSHLKYRGVFIFVDRDDCF
jgi:hypothetical protein